MPQVDCEPVPFGRLHFMPNLETIIYGASACCHLTTPGLRVLTRKLAICVMVVAAVAISIANAKTPGAADFDVGATASNSVQGFQPGMDDLMTMLVQPRHVKLFYAGKENNWEAAAYEARDLRSAFARITQTIPSYQGLDVSDSVKAIIVPSLDKIDAAIAKADPTGFASSYKGLTAACNACHTYMEHPFIEIQAPDASDKRVYPDQTFTPRRQ
jgi:hypothetical protein